MGGDCGMTWRYIYGAACSIYDWYYTYKEISSDRLVSPVRDTDPLTIPKPPTPPSGTFQP